jgi:hypothetical protein
VDEKHKDDYIELECGWCGYRKNVLKSKYELAQRNGQILLCERTMIATGRKCSGGYTTLMADKPSQPTSRP